MKVKAKSANKPAPDAAAAFARLLMAAQDKRPAFRVVKKGKAA